MNLFKLALRNVGRNPRRTIVTTGAMALAATMMVVLTSLTDGFTQSMERNALGLDLGEFQVHAEGYRDDPDIYNLIKEPQVLIEALGAQGFRAAPRMYGYGLASKGTASAGVELRGVQLAQERKVTRIHAHVAHGQWLATDAPGEVVLGRKAARTLGVQVGDKVGILSQASDGSMADDYFVVRGILRPVGERIDRSAVYMTESDWREYLLFQTGSHALVVVRAQREGTLDAATDRVRAVAPGLDTQNWRTLQPLLATMVDNSDVSVIILMLVTYSAIIALVLNAMLMSVFERIREFGVMKAIGVSPWQVGATIFLEALIQAGCANAVALALGVPIALWLQSHGLDLRDFSGSFDAGGIALEPIWKASVTARALLAPTFALVFIAALAVVWPAIKAAVIEPVAAMRHR